MSNPIVPTADFVAKPATLVKSAPKVSVLSAAKMALKIVAPVVWILFQIVPTVAVVVLLVILARFVLKVNAL